MEAPPTFVRVFLKPCACPLKCLPTSHVPTYKLRPYSALFTSVLFIRKIVSNATAILSKQLGTPGGNKINTQTENSVRAFSFGLLVLFAGGHAARFE